MALTIIDSNMSVRGQLSCSSFVAPAGAINNAAE